MIISFKSPSTNSPFVPALLSILSWILSNIFLFFGMRLGGVYTMMGLSMVTYAILFIFGILYVVILIAFLYRKKFANFFLSLVLIIISSVVTNFIDDQLAPYKSQQLINNMAGSGAVSPRHFGDSPAHVCNGKEGKDCNACYCPYSMDLSVIDGVPQCFFLNKNRHETNEIFPAPCSGNRHIEVFTREVTNLFGSDKTKIFALYKYIDNHLESCNEYRVWENWNPSVMQKACEHNSIFKCVVQDKTSCTTLSAKVICQKENTNTHEAIKLVLYSKGRKVDGFEQHECQANP